jgi:hypothetical protein
MRRAEYKSGRGICRFFCTAYMKNIPLLECAYNLARKATNGAGYGMARRAEQAARPRSERDA